LNNTNLNTIFISRDVFSKLFRIDNKPPLCVVYRTISQIVAVLEGDSAEVWTRIFESNGQFDHALEYILNHGQFTSDPEIEAKQILIEFLDSLESQGIISSVSNLSSCSLTDSSGFDAGRSTERMINLFMADNHILFNLVIELTYRCNEHCIHCYCPSNRNRQELSTEILCELILEFESMGGFCLQLTGGELLIREDIKSLLNFLCNRGLVITINSNLNLLDDEHIDLLKKLAPRSLGCSIYSAKAELHDSVTRSPGSFDRSIRNIQKVREAGIPVVIKTLLMKHTVYGWEDVEALANRLDCYYQFDLNITAKNDGNRQPLDLRVRDEEIIKHLFTTRFKRLHQNDEPLEKSADDPKSTPICSAGAAGLSISPNGEIHPCIGLPIKLGRYPKDPIEKVWHNSPFFESWNKLRLIDIPMCKECQTVADCFRCPGAWFVENGDVMLPNDYTCFISKIAAKASLSHSLC